MAYNTQHSIATNQTLYTVVTAVGRPLEFMRACDAVSTLEWPQFMLHDPVSHRYWHELYERFPEYQFALTAPDGDMIAIGRSIPLAWSDSLDTLPDEGWDWVLQKGVEDHVADRKPTIQSALEVVIPRKHRSKGIAALAVQEMRAIGQAHGLTTLIAPVRPTLKCQYPMIPMERYVAWQENGLPFDPWMRVHTRLGARIVKVCSHSMRITGTVAEWETWAGMRFPESGTYTVPGALVPVEIDRGQDVGIYVEPNVWMAHG